MLPAAGVLLCILAVLLGRFGRVEANVYAVDFGREYFKVGIASADAARKGNPIDMVLNEESKRKTPSSVAIELDGVTHVGANALAHAKRRPEASITGFPWLISDECPAGCKMDEASNEYICSIHNTDVTQSELVAYVADYITSILPLQTSAPAIAVVPPYASIEASTALISTLNNAQDTLDFSGTVTTIAGAAASYIMSAIRGLKNVSKAVIVVDSGGWETCIGSIFIESIEKENSNNVKQFKIEEGPSKCFPLAGRQIDEIIQKLIVKNSPISIDKRTLQSDAMKCKMTLSANDFCVVHMDDPNTGKHLTARVTRAEMIEETKNSGIVNEDVVSKIVQDVISNAYDSKLGQVPVVFVGGNTRVPLIKEYLTNEVENANAITSKHGIELAIYGGVNNDEGIVLGATIIGATQYYNSRVKIYYKKNYRGERQIYPSESKNDSRPFIGISRVDKDEFETLDNLVKKESRETMGEEAYLNATQAFLNKKPNKVHSIFDSNIECPSEKQITLMVHKEDLENDDDDVKVMFKVADYITNGMNDGEEKINGGAFSICKVSIPKKDFIPKKEKTKQEEEDDNKKKTNNNNNNNNNNEDAIPDNLNYEINLNLELSGSCLPLKPNTCSLYSRSNEQKQEKSKSKKGKKTDSKSISTTNDELLLLKENIPVMCTNYSYNNVIKKQDNLSPLSILNKRDTRPLFLLNPAPGPRNMGNFDINIRLNRQVSDIANLANAMIDELVYLSEANESVKTWNKIIDNLTEIMSKAKNDFKPSIARKISEEILDKMSTEISELYDYYTNIVGHPLRCNTYKKSQFLSSVQTEQEEEKEEENGQQEQSEKVYSSRLDALNDSLACLTKVHNELKDNAKAREKKFKDILMRLKNYQDRDETEKKTLDVLGKLKQQIEKIKNDNLVVEKVCTDPEEAMKNYMSSQEEESENLDNFLGSTKHSFWQKLFTKSNKPTEKELNELKAKYEKEYKQCTSYNDDARSFIKQRDAFLEDIEADLQFIEEKRKQEDEFEGADDEFQLNYTIDDLQDISDRRNKTIKRLISKYRTLKA